MNNNKLFLVLLILASLCGEARGAGVFDQGVGARPLGMGKAFAGLADDGGAIFINPAGLASLKNLNIVNMYSSPITDTRLITFGAASPDFLGGTIGAGYNNLTTSGIQVSSTEVVDYTQQALLLFYTRKINEKLALGGDLKLFWKGPSKDISPKTTGSGMDLDLSLKYAPKPWLGLGVNLQNFLPASLGGKITLKSGATEGIPANLKLGASAKLWGETYLNLDLDKDSSSPLLLHLGTEWWPVKYFAARAGIDQNSTLIDSQVFTNLTLGFGIKYAGITFDYAYYQRGEATRRVEHYFSLGYVGREEKVKPAPPPPLPTREVTVIKRKHFSDVPEGYWARDPIEILASIGIISGYPDGTFRPEKTITKAELSKLLGMGASENKAVSRVEGVIMIARFAGLSPEAVSEAPYSDLPGRSWAAPLILAAKREGLLKFIGYKFEPQKNLTRAEVAEILFQTKFINERLKDITTEFPTLKCGELGPYF